MATRNPQATGELLLVNYFHESSSTHYDKSRTVKPYVSNNGEIILEDLEYENNQFMDLAVSKLIDG